MGHTATAIYALLARWSIHISKTNHSRATGASKEVVLWSDTILKPTSVDLAKSFIISQFSTTESINV